MDFMIYMAGHAPAFAPAPPNSLLVTQHKESAVRKHSPRSLRVTQSRVSRAPAPCASTAEQFARDSKQSQPCAGTVRQHRRTVCTRLKAEPAVRKHPPNRLLVIQSRASRALAPSTWVVSGSCSANCVRRWDRSRAASSSRTPPPKARSLSCRGCTPRRGRKAPLCDRAGRALL